MKATSAGLLWCSLLLASARGQEPSCCDARVALGFSASPLRGGPPHAFLDATDTCQAAGATLETAPPGRVYVGYSSQLSQGVPGIQGCALSIEVSGGIDIQAGEALVHVQNRMPGEGGGASAQFLVITVIDPAMNAGARGIIMAQIFGMARTLTPWGTDSVLELTLVPFGEGVGPEQGRLQAQDGLRGTGLPVINLATVEGRTVTPCNAQVADLEVVLTALGPLRRGDANDDDRVDIADGAWILNWLFRGGPPAPCALAADLDRSGGVEIADALHLFRHQLSGGPAPAAPYPDCGAVTEQEAQGLGCEAASSCAAGG